MSQPRTKTPKFLFSVLAFFVVSACFIFYLYWTHHLDMIIIGVNSQKPKEKADYHAHNRSLTNATDRSAVVENDDGPILPLISDVELDLPAEFDSRIEWPFCPSIREISDQASCGCCWAMSAAAAMSDRHCIRSKGKLQFRYSTTNIVNCCSKCGKGCRGGSHRAAWKYWVDVGIVSGGPYDSEEGCQPYQYPPCEHHMRGPRPNCTKYGPTPKCEKICQPKYNVSYSDDLHFGKSAYSVDRNELAIRTEIFRHGPVQSSFRMFTDFFDYKSGVYEQVEGKYVDVHAIKIIGWGIDNVTSTPYWTVANTFNYDWGDNGFFLIKRGSNECGIEEDVTAGIPLLSDDEADKTAVHRVNK